MIKDYSFYVRDNLYSSCIIEGKCFYNIPSFQKIDLISAMFNLKVNTGDAYLHPGVSDAYWIDDVDTVYQRLGYQCRFQLGSYGSSSVQKEITVRTGSIMIPQLLNHFCRFRTFYFVPDPVPLISNVNKIHLQSMFNFTRPAEFHTSILVTFVLYYGYLKLNLE